MHQYDTASKILMETCRDELIRYFAGMEVEESTIIEELPQETVSVKRSDFPISTDLPVKMINRRKDIMIESAAYDIIKKDGIKEGIQQGLKQGLEEGKKETLLEFLEVRFGSVPDEVVAGI